MAFCSPARKRTALLWHRLVARILGLKINVEHESSDRGMSGVLLVSNHVSWVDIVVLGSISELHFIAKGEVRSWPIFGWLARMQDSVFVDRERRSATGDQANDIRNRLLAGDNLVLFAEGTTSDGNFLFPFKSSLFGSVATKQKSEFIPVQPVSIAYVGLGGLPMGRQWRQIAAWPGSVSLGEHLPRVLRRGAFDVSVRFGPVVADTQMHDRKLLCLDTEQIVRQMFASSLKGD